MYTIGRDPRERVEATAILPYYGLEVLQHSGFECTRSLDTSEI